MEQILDTKELLQQAEKENNQLSVSVSEQKLDVTAIEAEVAQLEQRLEEQELLTTETHELESSLTAIELQKGGRRI